MEPDTPVVSPTHNHDAASPSPEEERRRLTHRLARLVLASFVFTFVIARILVILIMADKLPPQLFFHVSGTHIHHLNYGIFLLSISGGISIFLRPMGRPLSALAAVYGIGLALTFDEFGMWLHLGGLYWQRVSFDAVIVIAALLALIAYGSTIRRWRPKHHLTVVALLALLGLFSYALTYSMQWADRTIGPVLYHLEKAGPS